MSGNRINVRTLKARKKLFKFFKVALIVSICTYVIGINNLIANASTPATLFVDGAGATGDGHYATLSDAYNAANSGDTIVLTTDVNLDSSTHYTLNVSKNITINGNKHTINGELYVMSPGTELMVENATMSSTQLGDGGTTSCIFIRGNNVNLTLTNCTLTADGSLSSGIRVDGSGVNLTTNSCNITGGFGIYVNNAWGQDNPGNPTVNITGGSISGNTSKSWGGVGILCDSMSGTPGTVSVNGATIYGTRMPIQIPSNYALSTTNCTLLSC